MGDFGLKISDVTKDVNTSNLNDTSFDSRYHSLMLLENKVLTFTADQGDTNPFNTEVYTHSLGYCPLTLGFITFTTGLDSQAPATLPYSYTKALTGGNFLFVYSNVKVLTNTIEVYWEATEYLPGESLPLTNDIDFTVTLNLYSYQLGYKTT